MEHLAQTQKLHELTPHNANTKRHMDDFCRQDTKQDISILSACFSFAWLQEHTPKRDMRRELIADLKNQILGRRRHHASHLGENIVLSESAHPSRTLFQFLNPKSDRRIDLNQVVCRDPSAKLEHYICLQQVWILMINDEILVTCSVLSEKELFGDLIQLHPPSTRSSTEPCAGHIKVDTPDGRHWLLRRTDCRTYFVGHFPTCTR